MCPNWVPALPSSACLMALHDGPPPFFASYSAIRCTGEVLAEAIGSPSLCKLQWDEHQWGLILLRAGLGTPPPTPILGLDK